MFPKYLVFARSAAYGDLPAVCSRRIKILLFGCWKCKHIR